MLLSHAMKSSNTFQCKRYFLLLVLEICKSITRVILLNTVPIMPANVLVFLNIEYKTKFVLYDAILNNYWSLPLSALSKFRWHDKQTNFQCVREIL